MMNLYLIVAIGACIAMCCGAIGDALDDRTHKAWRLISAVSVPGYLLAAHAVWGVIQ